jgi:hypothetical protein
MEGNKQMKETKNTKTLQITLSKKMAEALYDAAYKRMITLSYNTEATQKEKRDAKLLDKVLDKIASARKEMGGC